MVRARAWVQRLLLLGFGCLVAALAVEAALRVVGYSYPSFGRPDVDLGYTYVPGASGLWTEEGRSWIRINDAGFRDDPFVEPKPGDVYRIAVLGDSYLAGFGVPADSLFDRALERDLSGCPQLGGKRVEAMNFGVVGYGTAQELLVYRLLARRYEPDLVLLLFTGANDVRNNSRELTGEGEWRPYPVLEDGRLALDNRFRDGLPRIGRGDAVRGVVNASRLVQFVRRTRNVLRYRLSRGGSEVAAPPGGGVAEAGLDTQVYGPPPDSAWARAWAVTDTALCAVFREAAADGAGFCLVTITQGIQVHPDPAVRERGTRELAEQGMDAVDFFYPETRLTALGARSGFPVIPLAPRFLELAYADSVFFHGFPETGNVGGGHWNARGHVTAARIVAEELCRAAR